jgi:hypothetical protein
MYVSMWFYVYSCVYVCTSICVCMFMCVYSYECACMFLCVCTSMCVGVLCVRTCYVCIYMLLLTAVFLYFFRTKNPRLPERTTNLKKNAARSFLPKPYTVLMAMCIRKRCLMRRCVCVHVLCYLYLYLYLLLCLYL